jgi:hypothetical protein
VKRQVLYLSFRKVLGRIGLQGHAVIAHAFGTVSAHFVPSSRDFAILLVQ